MTCTDDIPTPTQMDTAPNAPQNGHTTTGFLNPQKSKKSYKQALLAEVEGAANRTGVDTFKLIHLIHTKQSQEQINGTHGENSDLQEDQEDESTSSENTKTRVNGQEWYTSRMRFQITIMETTQETYMEDLARQVNQVLEVINLNTPKFRTIQWR
jgi:hypothetical protein